MKAEASEAFIATLSPSKEFNVRGAFIDGQIQLMKAEGIRTWEQFFQVQYVGMISKFFREGSSDMVVVLAFDNYKHVPASKAMTQAKRKVRVQPIHFEEGDTLPPVIPMQWDCAMCNRVFKTKVILRVCEVVPQLVAPLMHGKQRLIIDFMDSPKEYSKTSFPQIHNSIGNTGSIPTSIPDGIPRSSTGNSIAADTANSIRADTANSIAADTANNNNTAAHNVPANNALNSTSKAFRVKQSVTLCGSGINGLFVRRLQHMEEIGECDCKFPRWVNYIASLHVGKVVDVIVESVDSDYIMIGMLHYEQQILGSLQTTLGRVMLRRIATQVKKTSKTLAASTSTAMDKEKKKRQYEYVHIPLLYEIMASITGKILGGRYPIRSFSLLVALAGTDFSRGTPQIGPHRMWEFLPHLLSPTMDKFLQQSSDAMHGCRMSNKVWLLEEKSESCPQHIAVENQIMVDMKQVMDRLMAGIYAKVWAAHCGAWNGQTFVSLCQCIHNPHCKLSSKTKDSFPSVKTMETTVRNVNWTLAYWMSAAMGSMQGCPNPLALDASNQYVPIYGYVLDAKGKPTWADLIAEEHGNNSHGSLVQNTSSTNSCTNSCTNSSTNSCTHSLKKKKIADVCTQGSQMQG